MSLVINIADARLAAAQNRLTAAIHQLQLAQERADYHNWNGGSSRAWTAANAEVKAARKALREIEKLQRKGGAA